MKTMEEIRFKIVMKCMKIFTPKSGLEIFTPKSEQNFEEKKRNKSIKHLKLQIVKLHGNCLTGESEGLL